MAAKELFGKLGLVLALSGAAGTASADLTLDSWSESLLGFSAKWTLDLDAGSFSSTIEGTYWDVSGLTAGQDTFANELFSVPVWIATVTAQHAHDTHEGQFGPVYHESLVAVVGSDTAKTSMAPHEVNATWITPADFTTPHWDHYQFKIESNGSSSATIYLTALHPVPEPESYSMMIAGLGIMGLIARRRSGRWS